MEKQKLSGLQEEDKVLLRLPDGMRAELKNISTESGRSLNSEIVYRLKASLSVPEDIVIACDDLNPIDRIDFAIKVLQRAGFNITLPTKEV
nr:Arc family DNA-binding protein [uncultured Undibacterium sp.]